MSRKKWKDRRDGAYIRDVDPMHKIIPYLLPRRTDSEVFLIRSVDVTNLMKYVSERKGIEGNSVSLFSSMVAAMVRTSAVRPALNRFVKGYRLYQRNDLIVGFVAKEGYEDDSGSHLVNVTVDPGDDIFRVSEKVYGKVNASRKGDSTGTDSAVDGLANMPRWFLRIAVRFLRFLDFHGWVPKSITKDDPNFASVFVSNMGSIGCGAPMHHLNEWGTNSIFLCIGEKYDKVVPFEGGYAVRPHIDFAFTVDERIADGVYFARSIDIFTKFLEEPSVMEEGYRGDNPD
ncbi:MAG: 2-oxo acid dehydrogenase subunit E2 [Thermoplasmatales archaeon]|nr:2-oxo acid dehydrogenase subunit E2 [Thermoplasmatales archaeon]